MKRYYQQIIKWTLIGLFIRISLMPFTMHGQDIIFINYFPMVSVTERIWDIYGFKGANSPYPLHPYYGPVLFVIMAIVHFIFIKVFNLTSLVAMLDVGGRMICRAFTTGDYVNALSGLGLFQNLFLMKIPYLIFDFLIAIILLRLATSKEKGLASYKLWMLNIVVLHSVYMVGQVDLIPALFIMAALYAAQMKRPYLSVTLLSLGGATKLFPYILILPACLLLGYGWRKKFLLILTAGAAALLSYLPFCLSSGTFVFRFFTLSQVAQYSGILKGVLLCMFVVLYLSLCINAVRLSHRPNPEIRLPYYFAVAIFLVYMTFPPKLRYFVSVTPLLALIIPGHKRFGIFILSLVLMIIFQSVARREMQLGLFAPLNPQYFLNLPTIQEIIGRFVNIEICYKIIARVLLLALFVAALWVYKFKKVRNET